MPKIKWIGIVDQNDIGKYQGYRLPENAVKTDMPKTMGEMLLKASPFAVPAFIVCMISMVVKCALAHTNVISLVWVIVGLGISAAYIMLHELLHALVYPKDATVSIGILKQFAAVALASYPLSRVRFAVMSLLPYILGLIPLIAFQLISPDNRALTSILFVLALMGSISPYPDAYNVYYMIKHIPKGSKVLFCGDDTYYIPKEA